MFNMFQSNHKFRGIMRNKMVELNSAKGRKKAPPKKRFSKTSLRKTIEDDNIIKSNLLSEETRPSSQIEMTSIEEPNWMLTYKQCTVIMRQVDLLQNEIAKQKIKKMSAVCEKKHDRVIQQFVEDATLKLSKCQRKIKEMEHLSNFDNQATPAEKRTFTSMIVSMACNIRDQTRKLRSQQQSELKRERELTSTNKNIIDLKTDSSQTQNWLSEQEFDMMEKDMMRSRDEQINKIVQSIYSLNSLYKELQTLVIEQGSLLDRIDENIQKSSVSVTEARKNLQKAKQDQQSGCIKKLRRFLVAAILVCLIIFFLKHI